MKRIAIFFTLLFQFLVIGAAVYTPTSLPNPKVQDMSNYVCNPDGIVENEDVAFLNQLARQLEDSTEVELCVVAIESIGETDAFDFCYELFQRWGIGKEGKNTGVLLFLAVESRDIRIMTGGGIEGVLPDAVCDNIIDKVMIAPLQKGDYSAGMALGALRIYEICTDGDAPEELRNMTSATNRYHYADKSAKSSDEEGLMGILLSLGIPLLIVLLIGGVLSIPKKCPNCKKRGLKKTAERVVSHSTLQKEGAGVRTYTCKYCGHQEQKNYVIPKQTPTVVVGGGGKSGGSFGGGSIGGFGGGSTFGGGAGRKF